MRMTNISRPQKEMTLRRDRKDLTSLQAPNVKESMVDKVLFLDEMGI